MDVRPAPHAVIAVPAVARTLLCAGALLGAPAVHGQPLAGASPAPRTLHVAGFGALTGPVSSFGIDSRAALRAAADSINRAGGVRLRDGTVARIAITYDDDHCDAGDALALVRRIAATPALVAVGPSCSGVAEPLYAALPRTPDDSAGIHLPVFTDGATKADLARLSAWAFRDTPNERDMYRALWAWVRRHDPSLHTVFGGEEGDFAHSHSTWTAIIGPEADAAGLTRVGTTAWSITDTRFVDAVTRMRNANADIVVLSAHPRTTCGVLAEMRRQRVRPRLVVGLTSAVSDATLHACGALAAGMLAPTTFVPITAPARAAARAVERAGGVADLHSMAAWEILFTLRQVIERSGVRGQPETVAADRRAIRDGLAALDTMDGLLGPIARTPEREARKPFVLVRATPTSWSLVEPSK